ncbi:MAG: hypothetical protein DME61_09800 [Verrucomicrobia bacterium]|nr:MAG: hypothetical protein DME61_09800 [Verrucomicrobiota bacterium]PYL69433.1 MAG: hypothetical protein DMF28_03360 [Verrucomicrobiota bacterium]
MVKAKPERMAARLELRHKRVNQKILVKSPNEKPRFFHVLVPMMPWRDQHFAAKLALRLVA